MYIDSESLGWNIGKNSKLKEERGVSFEMVRDRLFQGAFSIIKNPSRNHPGQRCFLVTLNGEKWKVPFRERAGFLQLFTIMRAR
jgi:hypothetical protein